MVIRKSLLIAANDVVRWIVEEEYKTSSKTFRQEVLLGRGQPPCTKEEGENIAHDFYYALEQVLEENGYELTKYSYSKLTPIIFECKTKY